MFKDFYFPELIIMFILIVVFGLLEACLATGMGRVMISSLSKMSEEQKPVVLESGQQIVRYQDGRY